MGSDELSEEIAKWDREAMRQTATSADTGRAEIAAVLLSDRELKKILLSRAGKAWLTETSLRSASVNFLRSQERVVSRDRAEIARRYDVFMSFAKEDSGAVSKITEVLADMGFSVFIDKNLPLGSNWALELERGLKGARATCVCIGPGARISEWREHEINAALSMTSEGHRVIPVLLPGSDPALMPDSLRVYQWLDLRSGINSASLRNLVDTLR